MSSKYYNLSTDTTLGGNSPSDYVAPSEKAIKTYVDNNAGSSLPSQTGNAGKVLTTDGTDASWGATAQVYPVVETYSNGASWYIVYSNGFCIQGSLYYKGSTIAGDNQIIFLKEFVDTNYTFLALPAHSSANVAAYAFAEKYASRTTAQTILYSPGALFGYQWVAYGYVSMGS